jgi:peroxiredoxin
MHARRSGPGDVRYVRRYGRVEDIELLDHGGDRRRLSDLVAGDPAILQFFRSWWCPNEQAFFRRLVDLQDDVEVAYARMVSVSVDPPKVDAASSRCSPT